MDNELNRLDIDNLDRLKNLKRQAEEYNEKSDEVVRPAIVEENKLLYNGYDMAVNQDYTDDNSEHETFQIKINRNNEEDDSSIEINPLKIIGLVLLLIVSIYVFSTAIKLVIEKQEEDYRQSITEQEDESKLDYYVMIDGYRENNEKGE